jgi:hypothetical protein
MNAERRKSRRARVDVSARLWMETEGFLGTVRDICRDAVLVEANRWYPVGTTLSVEAELPGAEGTLHAAGRVVRLAPGEEGMHGMAILFDDLPEKTVALIDRFVAAQED